VNGKYLTVVHSKNDITKVFSSETVSFPDGVATASPVLGSVKPSHFFFFAHHSDPRAEALC
jgi:hypothetical protein